uniref:Uncharacterized protein n=1 Tax=Oryza rufipogon TaxID=4529 RepID=A0A0E0RBR7_ORYRU
MDGPDLRSVPVWAFEWGRSREEYVVDCLPSDRDIGDGYSEADGSDAFVAAEGRIQLTLQDKLQGNRGKGRLDNWKQSACSSPLK